MRICTHVLQVSSPLRSLRDVDVFALEELLCRALNDDSFVVAFVTLNTGNHLKHEQLLSGNESIKVAAYRMKEGNNIE